MSELVQELVERAPVVGFVKDHEGKYLYVNEPWLLLFDRTREQVLGKDDRALFPEDFANIYVANDSKVRESGQQLEVYERVLVRDVVRTYLSTKFPLRTGGQIAVGGISVDVSHAEDSRAALAQSEGRFRRLVEHSPEALVVFDMGAGHFVQANDNACRLFGRSREELLQKTPIELSPEFQPDGRSSAECARGFLEAALLGEFPVFNWTHLDATGEPIPCRIWLARMDDAGEPWVRASILDTREIDRAKEALSQAQLQLERSRRLEGLGRLAGGVAHDFNNLLTIMVGSVTFLGEMANPSQETKEELKVLSEAVLQARGLTRQLLAFAREPAGLAQSVDLDATVARALETLRRLVGEDVHLTTELRGEGACIWIDPSQLDQILLNLVVNAREAVARGGNILVQTERGSAELPGGTDCVSLCVTDDGHGMSEEIMEKAFDPFFSTKAVGHGTGLGLSTVYGIVQASGGQATIHSRAGEGTSMRVRFPCWQGTEKQARQTSAPPSDGPKQACILVVEDEQAVRRVTTRILIRSGYQVIEAESPEQALEMATRERARIALVVSDVVMPGMNGFELAKRLRTILDRVPVLFVSGYPSAAVDQSDTDLAHIDLLPKPFTADELRFRVARALLAGAELDAAISQD